MTPGAFVAVDRGDRASRERHRRRPSMARSGRPAGAVGAPAWRCVDIRAVDDRLTRDAGVLLGHAGTADPIDATVVLIAESGDRILTPDPEAWVARRVEEGIDVLACHSRLAQTGLDLVDFPTIVWSETEFSVSQSTRKTALLVGCEPARTWPIGVSPSYPSSCRVAATCRRLRSFTLRGERAAATRSGSLCAQSLGTSSKTTANVAITVLSLFVATVWLVPLLEGVGLQRVPVAHGRCAGRAADQSGGLHRNSSSRTQRPS